jgi:hypothetical protein
MTTEKREINWTQIENDYRAGIKPLRQIAEENTGVSHVAIKKRADKAGWERDLSARIKAKADAAVNKAAVNKEVNKARAATDREVVEANAELQYKVRIAHRVDIQRVKALLLLQLGEAELQTVDIALFKQLGELMASPDDNGVDKLNELYKKALSLPQRVTVVKQVTETLAMLIKLEREAFGIDKEEKASGGYESLLRELYKAAALAAEQ